MRRGVILADSGLLVEMLHASEDARYALAGVPCDTLHAALLLPASYRVVEIAFDRQFHIYRIYLEGEHLPDEADGYDAPRISPMYTRYYDENVTRLTSLSCNGKELPLT